MIAAPAAGFIGILLANLQARAGRQFLAFFFSSCAVTGIILTAGLSMFPFVMPSSTVPQSSLTLWDAASSHRTMSVIFIVAIVFLPLITLYTSWVYRVMRGKVTVKSIQENTHTAY
jgi:cytochrome d ubiquinol oxidase subunit II